MTTRTRRPRSRLRPDQRREQLLALGTALLASRSLDELSIDMLSEQAGVSRGLLYHYFGSKQGFHEAVVRRAAQDLYEKTAPPATGEPLDRLLASITVYVDYVVAHQAGYRSLVAAAAGGDEALRRIYDDTFAALADRVFAEDADGLVSDTPATRLVVRGWQRMTEELVLAWCEDPVGVSRADLVRTVAASLPALVAVAPPTA